MTQARLKSELMTLEEFLDWVPDDGQRRYELHQGEIIEMQPTGPHEQVIGLLVVKLGVQIESLELPYLLATRCIIKSINSDYSGFNPDLTILDIEALENEPLWKKRSTITKGETAKLAIEVVSSNWQDDYLMKVFEYETMGIGEYWLIDYLGLGGKRFIGNPKQPTIFVYQMVEGEYEVKMFRGNDRIESRIFPKLNLTADRVFEAGR